MRWALLWAGMLAFIGGWQLLTSSDSNWIEATASMILGVGAMAIAAYAFTKWQEMKPCK